ncbi:hypothetical protein F4861DRAFT_167800 [Xylaria intraflava]|nr:hypothetical protein F4861DRAFT_167800 [Xylaria intraflava]
MLQYSGCLVFAKLPASTRLLWECQTRHLHHKKARYPKLGVPLRQHFPEFFIPDILLDLDAEGAKGVREFNYDIDGKPEPAPTERRRQVRALAERVSSFETTYREYESSFRSLTDNAFNPSHITDFDVLIYSYLDPHNTAKTAADLSLDHPDTISYAKMLGSVIERNGIPYVVRGDTSKTTTYMLRRQHFAQRESGRASKISLKQALNECQSFSELERVVAKATKTGQGCKCLSELSDEVHTALTSAEDAEPSQLLSLLNNLVVNMEHKNYYMSTKIYELGIWTSLKCHAIITAEQYLRKRLKHGDRQPDDNFTNSLLTEILQNSIASSPVTTSVVGLNPSTRLMSIFSFLTGYVPGEDTATASIRSLVRRDRPTGFRLYIRCLARLGAFRTIWHEWHNTSSDIQDIGADTGEWPPEEKGYMAETILDVLAANDGVREVARSPDLLNFTHQYRTNCQLDIVTVSKFAEILSLSEKEMKDKPLDAEERARLHQSLSKEDIQAAMRALQTFLNR